MYKGYWEAFSYHVLNIINENHILVLLLNKSKNFHSGLHTLSSPDLTYIIFTSEETICTLIFEVSGEDILFPANSISFVELSFVVMGRGGTHICVQENSSKTCFFRELLSVAFLLFYAWPCLHTPSPQIAPTLTKILNRLKLGCSRADWLLNVYLFSIVFIHLHVHVYKMLKSLTMVNSEII